MNIKIIKTSQEGWLKDLAVTYKEKTPVTIFDDAKVGIDLTKDSIFDMGRKAELTTAEITAVCVAIGMSVTGIGMILLAFFDPEPTTKLGLLIGGGATLLLTGGFSAIYVLTKQKPPKVKIGPNGIEVEWA
ncbi:MAG: hypothetical protein KJ914_03815 [Gammaproteobacteria bacterium]|nr:hypothetical protein [Gammaproteobacteria bacterium]MBU1722664.1 hypothetical protein [Gammaproteobacteria bacterium]MBU2006711.1 hypothetical protein [Gammaproteobacteria bacterium]